MPKRARIDSASRYIDEAMNPFPWHPVDLGLKLALVPYAWFDPVLEWQARRGEIVLKARGERRVRGDSGNVGHYVFGGDCRSIPLGQKARELGLHVGDGCVSVAPEREHAPTKRAFVVVKVRNKSGEREGGSASTLPAH